MANTSGRMLKLLSLLQTHRFWPGGDLADRLEVSQRTLRRDVDRLRELGYPVAATRGVSGGYQLGAGGSLPPLLLDDDEAIAVAVGLRGTAGGTVSGVEETSVRALAKLVQVMPPRLRRRVDALRTYSMPAFSGAGGGQTVDAAALATIAQGCRDSERLRFAYTPRAGQAADRHAEPYRLVWVGRRWYLVAFDLDRSDWRTFRVDRMSAARSTGARFRQRELPAADAAAYVRERLAAVPTRYEVLVDIRATPARVRRLVGQWGTVEPLGADACRLTMHVDSLDWPVFLLGAVGAPFTVESPPELRSRLHEAADHFAQC
jgi:predicted DNA-binding transcriptional regulator YafY